MAEKETREVARWAPQRVLSPFQEMERMEKMFEEFFRRPFSLLGPTPWLRNFPEMEEVAAPNVDVYEEGDNIVVKAEVPGIRKEDIDVSFKDNNTIVISGEKKKEERVENKNYYRLERSYGTFSRSMFLPTEVNPEKASATFKDGILEILIPKTEESKHKVKKIPIK